MTVIDDVCSGLSGYWNTNIITRPRFLDGSEKMNKPLNAMHKATQNTIYVTNFRSHPRFVDPERTYKDVVYRIDVDIFANDTGDRDNMFNETYRILEVTGISGYDNREIEWYGVHNDFEQFSSEIRFNITKYNESVSR